MIEITTMRIWIGVSIAWPLLWLIVVDRWFFLSPFGLIIAFGMPIAGWVFWWNCYREENQRIVLNDKLGLERVEGVLLKLKKRLINNQKASNQ